MADIRASSLIAYAQNALDNHWGYIWGTAEVLWTEARQKQLEKTTDADRKSSRENGRKWIGHIVTDCSGLFSGGYHKLGGYMYHGSNTMWNRYTTAKGQLKNGKRTDGQELKPGTAVFCEHGGKRTHVGLYIGSGYVIEASGPVNGVIKTKITNKKWVEWGELKGMIFDVGQDTREEEPMATETRPTLRKGSMGTYVLALQTMLVNRGYDVGAAGVDGDFGSGTLKAVKQFQQDAGLVMDGIVGPKTWAALDGTPEDETAMTYTATIQGLTKDQVAQLLKSYPAADIQQERE